MNSLLIPILIMGIIGAVLGLLIAIVNKVFFVKDDERVTIIYDMLPHYDCGACGTPGCMAMAGELVEGNITIDKCRPAKPEQRDSISSKLLELLNDVDTN